MTNVKFRLSLRNIRDVVNVSYHEVPFDNNFIGSTIDNIVWISVYVGVWEKVRKDVDD